VTAVDEPIPPSAEDRAADLVLARLHLRLGSFGLARAELESLAGRRLLDDEGIRDLAEARWRTGDLPGAGEAAEAYLDLVPDDPLSLVISAELQSHLGRPAEARRIAGRAIAADEAAIDTLFAGMPRSPIWPVEPGAPIEPIGTLFAELSGPLPAIPGAPAERSFGPRLDELDGDPLHAPPAENAPGLWEHSAEAAAPVLPDPGELLSRARAALRAGRPGQASASLALALRAEPSLAPAVLDLIAGRTEPVLALVRGDAHRIVGHEAEAIRDYVAAVAAIGLERADDARRAPLPGPPAGVEPSLSEPRPAGPAEPDSDTPSQPEETT
jgi:tetratricopeptide (TPR) repeat protein